MIRLATIPALHANRTVKSVLRLFGSTSSLNVAQRPPVSPEPNAKPSLEASSVAVLQRPSIPPDAWDDLFQAVVMRLENCVDDPFVKSQNSPPQDRSAATKIAVLECVEAMKQLHSSLAHKRTAQINQ